MPKDVRIGFACQRSNLSFLGILCLAGLLLGLLPGRAEAQTCNNAFIGNIFNGAMAISTTSMAFGTYSPASAAPTQGNEVITAYCFGGLLGATLPPFTIAMSAGGGSFTQRLMASGTVTLRYQIYTSAALSTVWGDGTGSTSTVSAGNDGMTSETITAYGVIPARQFPTPGSFTDAITVTVTY